jgi:predicted nuclease of predicted toxin-antitoxin system
VAAAEGRTLVTLDLDFANPLRFSPHDTAGVVVLRVPRPVVAQIEAMLRAALPRLKQGPLANRLWIVEPGRIREYDPEDEG